MKVEDLELRLGTQIETGRSSKYKGGTLLEGGLVVISQGGREGPVMEREKGRIFDRTTSKREVTHNCREGK